MSNEEKLLWAALDAIHEGMSILYMLAHVDNDERWLDGLYKQHLDGIAERLGFYGADAVDAYVEAQRQEESDRQRDVYDVETCNGVNLKVFANLLTNEQKCGMIIKKGKWNETKRMSGSNNRIRLCCANVDYHIGGGIYNFEVGGKR